MPDKFNGIFAPLTTPFLEDEISLEKFKENIQKYNHFDLSGYVILGSTGESVFLSDEESEKLVSTAKENASPGKKIIVGTARESTKITLEFTNRMAELNIDAVLIRTPYYFRSLMDREALKKFYLTIAEQSKVPVLIYNIPRNTGVSIESHLLFELAKHPNIAGLKDSSGNLGFLREVIPHLNSDFSFLTGAGRVLLPELLLGASGGILALADAAPAQCVRIYNLFKKGDKEEALKLQLSLVPLNKAIIQTYGIPGLKYALDLLGYYGGPPRPPLLLLEKKGKLEIKSILEKTGLLKK